MPRVEYIGRYRRAGNSRALFIPLELRRRMQEQFGWKEGDYLVIVPNNGLLLIQRLDKSMLLDRQQEAQRRNESTRNAR